MYSLDEDTRNRANTQFIKDTWNNAPERQGPQRVLLSLIFIGFKEICASVLGGAASAVVTTGRFASSQMRNLVSSHVEQDRLTVSHEANEDVASVSEDLQEANIAKSTSVHAESNERVPTGSASLRS